MKKLNSSSNQTYISKFIKPKNKINKKPQKIILNSVVSNKPETDLKNSENINVDSQEIHEIYKNNDNSSDNSKNNILKAVSFKKPKMEKYKSWKK